MNGDEPHPNRDRPLLLKLLDKGIYRYGYSLRYFRPRGFNLAEVWGPERVDISIGFGVNPYMYIDDDIDIDLRRPGRGISILNKLMKSLFKVGGYDHFPLNLYPIWRIALKFYRDHFPWPRPSKYIEPRKPKLVKLSPDVLIIGGGISGLHAGLSTSRLGLKTVILEMDYWIGGRQPLYNPEDPSGNGLERLAEVIRKNGGEIYTSTVFQGFHSDYAYAWNWRENTVIILEPKTFIFATGHYEVPPLIENIDLPLTLPSSTYLKLLKRFGYVNFKRPIVYGGNPRVEYIEEIFEKLGVEGVFIGYKSNKFDSYEMPKWIRVEGRDKFEQVVMEINGEKIVVEGDVFVYCEELVSNSWPTMQLGLTHLYIDGFGGYIPWHDIEGKTESENIFIAGSLGGVYNFQYDVLSGLVAGLSAGEYLGLDVDKKKAEYVSQIRDMLNKDEKADRLMGSVFRRESVFPIKFIERYRRKEDVIICKCTDVSLEDIDHSIERLGERDIELLKRYSGVLTGRCQGKLCLYNLLRYIHVKHGGRIKNIHHRVRPPYIPQPIYTLEV